MSQKPLSSWSSAVWLCFPFLGLGAACSAGGPASAEVGNSGSSNSVVMGLDPGTPLIDDGELAPSDECDGVLPVVYRDFHESHPDFEMDFRGDGVRRELVAPELGADGTPVFASSTGCRGQDNAPLGCADRNMREPVIASAATFYDWYHDVPGTNHTFSGTLTLTESPPDSGKYVFNSNQFFPIGNTEGFGITPAGRDKNFLFTTEIHLTFDYVAGQTFKFVGDDDLWIFVNGKLALDLGSMHGAEDGTIDFDAQAASLQITPGRPYAMDIFHAERHTDQSNFSFETNISCFVPSILR